MDLAEHALTEASTWGESMAISWSWSYATGVLGNNVYLPRGDIARPAAMPKKAYVFSREIGLAWSEGASRD